MKAVKKAGRTADGKFAKGNQGGPGRPPRHVEVEYMAGMFAACTLEDWQEIISKAVSQAKAGDVKARAWLASYLIGSPKNGAKSFTEMESNKKSDERFSFMDF